MTHDARDDQPNPLAVPLLETLYEARIRHLRGMAYRDLYLQALALVAERDAELDRLRRQHERLLAEFRALMGVRDDQEDDA